MRRSLLFVAAFVVLTGQGAAQDAGDGIKGVIAAQIEAFERDDLEEAFGYASSTIRTLFGTPDRFGEMVEQGYPMVRKPSSVRFGSTSTRNGREYQTVVFQDSAGHFHALEYEMVPSGSGWKINGVRFVPMPDVGA